VVVRGVNWVGDAVMSVPALRELRRLFPGARMTLATRPWAEGIFAGADFIDDFLVTGNSSSRPAAIFREAREWRTRRFDLAVLLPNAFAPALVAALARVPVRVGYATQGRSALLTHRFGVPEWRGSRHEVFYYLHLVAELERQLYGSSSIESREPDTALHVAGARLRKAQLLLSENGARPGRPLVAMCPGSTNSRAKRWPAERFAAVADLLSERAGAEIVLVGAAEELEISQEVARHMRMRPVVLTGQTDLAQTAAVLKASDLLVTNDTGPAHVAAAVGCPVVVIFGPTNPITTRPFSNTAEVVRRPPDCAPCMLRDCPIDHRCMTAITPEEVFERATHALELRQKVEVAR
jgi:lipopolysaccharide heptosyltransferase II